MRFISVSNPNTIPLLVLLVGGLGLAVSLGIIPLAQFPEETISVSVHPHNVEVHGLYTYKNPWPFPITQGFGLPFPIDAEHPAPLPIELCKNETGEPIPTFRLFDDDVFTLSLAPHEKVSVSLYYKQETRTNNARYILTTTQSWRSALKRAHYFLKTEGVGNIQSNYPMNQDQPNIWHWERQDFMPRSDWLIKWEVNS